MTMKLINVINGRRVAKAVSVVTGTISLKNYYQTV